jgi:phospholipid/cholesterol/gamma-HCH transport system ATP-binding protein
MLVIKDLHVTLNNKSILSGIHLDLLDGESLVLLGCSGTGKSILLKSIIGIVPRVSGSVVIDGVDIDSVCGQERLTALNSIGMLFQGGALFDSLPVWENIAFALIYGKRISAKEAKKIALDKMELVGLDYSVANAYPSDISGGMAKRVALARALTLQPKIILFDEPTSGLDPISTTIVNELIIRFVRDLRISAVTITHDINSARKIADKINFLFDGKIIWSGSVQGMENTENPYIRQFLDAQPFGPLTHEVKKGDEKYL